MRGLAPAPIRCPHFPFTRQYRNMNIRINHENMKCCVFVGFYCWLFLDSLAELLRIHWVVHPPSNSHHQEYYIFSRGSGIPINLHLPLLLGGGTNQRIHCFCWGCFFLVLAELLATDTPR